MTNNTCTERARARASVVLPQPTPMPPAPMLPPTAFAINPAISLHWNIVRLVESRLRRPLTPALSDDEQALITAALVEGLSFLMPNDDARTRQELIDSNALVALLTQGMAWLWAPVLEATSEHVSTVEGVVYV